MKLPFCISQELVTVINGWFYAALFMAAGLTLATLIVGLNRDYHVNFSDGEQTTRQLNQLLTIVIVFFALLESILTPSRVIDGHSHSSSLFYLTHVPKNIRVGLYMLAMATVEPHVFNMFYDAVKAEVQKPINWTMEDFIGETHNDFAGIKIAILQQGPMPRLYEQFIEDDFQYLLIFSRMFLYIGGLVVLPLAVLMPSKTDWDSQKWGFGNQRWYEKAQPGDPDLRIDGFSEAAIFFLNFFVGVIKGAVPFFGIMFHYNEFVQHRDDPAHNDAERLYDYYDPFHLNHAVHSLAMLAYASYLALDAARHIFAPVVGGRTKNRLKNYAVVHLFTLFAHVYLVSTMVDANGPETKDGEDYIMANWIFVSAHAALYLFQELALAPYISGDRSFFMVPLLPIRYAQKWFRILFFTEFIVDRYMSMMQTVASVTGMLALVLLVIGINGPWVHATPIPGSVVQEFSKVIYEAERFMNNTRIELNRFFTHIESSDLYRQLSCTFIDNEDSGTAGSDYMTCRRADLSTWMKGHWHPCDTIWREDHKSKWTYINMNNLTIMSQDIAQIMLDNSLTEAQKQTAVTDLIDSETAGPMWENKNDGMNPPGPCDPTNKNPCYCHGGTVQCTIPYGLGDDFRSEIADLLVANTINYGVPAVATGGGECTECDDQCGSDGCTVEQYETCATDGTCSNEPEQRLAGDIFEKINDLQANPFFDKDSGRYDPVEWRQSTPKGYKRWDQQFGTKSTYDTGFLGLKHVFDGNPNGHTRTMKENFLDEKCMRQCNGCPQNKQNHATDHNTISRHAGADCGGLISACECYANGHNHGLTTEKRTATNDEKGFCLNMKRCFYDDELFQQAHGKDKDMWNQLRYSNDNNLTHLFDASSGTSDWERFAKITEKFYDKGAMTNETTNPNHQSEEFSKFVQDVNNSGNFASNLKLHDIFCMDSKNQKLPECQDALAELDNFAGSTFMLEAEKRCRTIQCDTFLVMMAVATAMKVAAMAISLFPFGGGDIGDAILAAEEALEYTIRLMWRFFQFGLQMYRIFRVIKKRIDYYWLLTQGWRSFIVFNQFLVTITMKLLTSLAHVLVVGFFSFFIAFWRRQRLVGRQRDDVFNLMILLMSAAVLLGVCVTTFLALTPWALNWLIDQVLTFHHETNFVKSAFIDIKMVEDIGYVFLILSSICATYSAGCWLVLLIKQKDRDIRDWILGNVPIGAPYEFKNSILGSGRRIANTGKGAWLQTAIWMAIVAFIIYGSFDIAEVNNKWVVRGAVFHMEKYTDSAVVDKISKFFKTNALTSNFGDVDDAHSTLCDLIGQAIKELFLDILKALLNAVSDITHYLTQHFSPAVRFVYQCIKRDFGLIMFDTFHASQLLVVFAPPIACVLLFFVGVSASIVGATTTSQVWIRNLIFIVALNGVLYSIALQGIASTFDEIKIPIFGYRIVFTTAILRSQICSMLCFASWVQWRFDEKIPLCRDGTCGEEVMALPPVAIVDDDVVLAEPAAYSRTLTTKKWHRPNSGSKKRLRLSSLH